MIALSSPETSQSKHGGEANGRVHAKPGILPFPCFKGTQTDALWTWNDPIPNLRYIAASPLTASFIKMDFRQRPAARRRVYDDFTPPHELVQKDDEELFIINLTGFAKEQLRVQVKRPSRKVVIIGERPLADGNRWSRLHKEFSVPDCCNIRGVGAKFNDGVLCLSLPKLSFKSPPKEEKYEKDKFGDTTEPGKRGLDAPARAMPELRLGDWKLKVGRLDFELYEVKQLAMTLAGARLRGRDLDSFSLLLLSSWLSLVVRPGFGEMSFGLPAYGIQAMLKEGHKHLSGLDEAVLKNIDACKQLSDITRTSLGPNGMNKMVINHLDKLFVTNDAATIVDELEVQHPAAKILVLAGKAQQEEIGDGANLTISFAGELLQNAEELIRMGLHPSDIISGYTKAVNKTVAILDELVEKGSETMDVRNKDEVFNRMRASVASKQFGQEDVLCPLIADACIQVCPKNPANFNVDNVRVAKLLGGGLHNSLVVRGMVLKGDTVGTIKRVEKAKTQTRQRVTILIVLNGIPPGVNCIASGKGGALGGNSPSSAIVAPGTTAAAAVSLQQRVQTRCGPVTSLDIAVFAGGIDTSATETKGTVLIHTAEQLENYAKTEEAKVEELVKAVVDSGAKVVVSGAAVGDMALHFCERYKLMVLKISSKFELRRFCRTTGAVALLKLSQPNPDELGYADSISVTLVKNEQGGNSVSTVVLRGSTDSILDDLERAVDDGVNTYKAMCRDSRILPGAAATEIELARRLKDFALKETDLDQYAIAKFAESFEMVPKILAENAGLNAMEIISSLYAEHASGNSCVGIDLEEGVCKDVSTMNIWDIYVTKSANTEDRLFCKFEKLDNMTVLTFITLLPNYIPSLEHCGRYFALKYAADAACTVLRVDQIIMSKPAGGPRRDQQPGMDED
ncbi:hypothetical protein ZIOFF_032998 [Zingiber officinale]|uniref:CCT-theta n=1 Tax=Zingiber officinale TaxID=94328 RepID=A0A8J5GHF4_ZINOF|nr:hypothetical protein ZIOFF_032998 [Zingiber officinale]